MIAQFVRTACIQKGKKCLLFSLEMSEEQMKNRLIKDEPAKGVIIDDTPAISIEGMKRKLNECGGDIDYIFIDYLQLIEEKETAVGDLKVLAKESGIPVIAAFNLSRDLEDRDDKHPVLEDLGVTSEELNNIDNVIMLYRDGYYDFETKRGNEAEILIEKSANGQGKVVLEWDPERRVFKCAE